jgi:diguanylate cyclase (GGDEF)-like protein
LNRKAIAYSAAAMYGGAAFVGVVEGITPGGPAFSVVPTLAALVVVALLLVFGPRIPRAALAPLGLIGAALIAYALASTQGPAGDGAVLYVWPVLWTAFFFGRSGTALIVAWIGLVHGLALISMPPGLANIDRWIDVMGATVVVAVVVRVLEQRNSDLLGRLAAEARTDKLTGLLNRRGFDELAVIELALARRERYSVAVAMFDIDHFKLINDEWGHEIGDRVLARLGNLLVAQARGIDVVARIGGEEFVAMLPLCSAVDADAYTQRVRHALASTHEQGLPDLRVSAGVAAEVGPTHTAALLQRADGALYAAKRGGRDRTVVDGTPLQIVPALLAS